MASDTIRNATLQSFEHRAGDHDRFRLEATSSEYAILAEEARRAPETMPDKNPVATLSQADATAAVHGRGVGAERGPGSEAAPSASASVPISGSSPRDLRLMATNGNGKERETARSTWRTGAVGGGRGEKREKVTSRRFAVLLPALVVVLGTIATFVAATVTGAAGILNSCDLNTLEAGRDRRELLRLRPTAPCWGAIPAERNSPAGQSRQHVPLD